MGLGWPSGGDSGKEATFNQERANKWTESIVPISGTSIRLSGGAAGSKTTPVLSGNVLYMLVSKNDCHICSGAGVALTASNGDQYWATNTPYFHIPRPGATDVVAVVNDASTNVECWVSPVEYLDG